MNVSGGYKWWCFKHFTLCLRSLNGAQIGGDETQVDTVFFLKRHQVDLRIVNMYEIVVTYILGKFLFCCSEKAFIDGYPKKYPGYSLIWVNIAHVVLDSHKNSIKSLLNSQHPSLY